MRSIVQRVSAGKVSIEGEIKAAIGRGWVVLFAVGKEDTAADAKYMAEKIANLRIFPDECGKLNLSVKDIGGEILLVSQFTLYADCRKGRRPCFTDAAEPIMAKNLYEATGANLKALGLKLAKGVFQTDMLVDIKNDGPVTIMLDSKKLF